MANLLEIEPSIFEDNPEDDLRNVKSDSKDKPIQFHFDAVSPLNMCETRQASILCILDLAHKLKNVYNDHYDIGGTYTITETHEKPDFWFYYTISKIPVNIILLNLFVCHRNVGLFKIGISETKLIHKKTIETKTNVVTYLSLPDKLTWKLYKTCHIDQSHHILSLRFTREDLDLLYSKAFCIPMKIDDNPQIPIQKEVLTKLKIEHDLDIPFKKEENTDFNIESTSGKTYKTHKLLLAASSSILRDIIKTSKSDSAHLDINDVDTELLLEYVYTCTLKNITDNNFCEILELANKFKLSNLIDQVGEAILKQLTVTNAVDMAVLSEKYKLYNIQKTIFEFIKDNQGARETEAWKNLNDAVLTKKMIETVYTKGN